MHIWCKLKLYIMKTKLLTLLLLGLFTSSYAQTTIISEDFMDVYNLPGSTTLFSEGFENITGMNNNGWQLLNKSNPVGVITDGWFQGDTNVFTAETGSNNGYAGSNSNCTSGTGVISSWMITPTLSVQNGDIITFWSRTVLYNGASVYPDRMEFRMSTAGDNSVTPSNEYGVGTFTNNLTTINPSLDAYSYPETWTRYNIVVSGLSGLTDCKFAFRYFVTTGGPSGTNSNYIGIDSFSIKRPSWTILNKSNPIGQQASGWFQGNPPVFPAQTGISDSEYAGANYNATGSVGTISSWFITPTINLQNQDVVSFWTRTVDSNQPHPDRLEVRISSLGDNSIYPNDENSVGSFTTLLTVINPNLNGTSYPKAWTEFTNIINGLSGLTHCKIAFRYYVINGGIQGGNSNYIGLDTFSVTRSALNSNSYLSGDFKLKVYPNPALESLTIVFPDGTSGTATISICDTLGKEITRYENSVIETNTLKIALNSNLSKGIYLLKIVLEGKTYTQKFIKE